MGDRVPTWWTGGYRFPRSGRVDEPSAACRVYDRRMQVRRRKPTRCPAIDYRENAWFFVTIHTADGGPVLAEVRDDRLVTTPAGIIVEQVWCDLPSFYEDLGLDTFTVMPDHVHGILHLPGEVSLSDVVARLKSISAVDIGRCLGHSGAVWQRSFWDHLIRNEFALQSIREYIRQNPARLIERMNQHHRE